MRTCRSATSSAVRSAARRAVARRASRLAARVRHASPRGGDVDEARGDAVRGRCPRGRVRRVLGDGRRSWRPLLLAGGAAFALTLPWRIWFTAVGIGIGSDAPESGYLGSFRHLDRVLAVAAARPPDAVRPGSLAVRRGARRRRRAARRARAAPGAWPSSERVFLAAAVAACSWAIWSNPSLSFSEDDSLNPIVRLTGTTILSLAVLTPLLLQAAWTGSGRREARPRRASPGPDALVWRSLGAWAIVLLGVLSHPGSMLLGYSRSGLPGGAPAFPSHADCVTHTLRDSGGRLVGYADSYPEAFELRRRALSSGLRNVEVRRDGCGRVRVFEGVS